jgi:DNA-binding response OmpR family regulator
MMPRDARSGDRYADASPRPGPGSPTPVPLGGSISQPATPPRVLCIDDEAPIRTLARVNLEANGFEVLEAADGTEGLRRARAEKPDLILLDVMMPGVDGWRVGRELVADEATNDIPIIFLTARSELRDRAQGLDLGAVEYVTKPFNPLELAPLIKEVLARVGRGEADAIRRERLADLQREIAEA